MSSTSCVLLLGFFPERLPTFLKGDIPVNWTANGPTTDLHRILRPWLACTTELMQLMSPFGLTLTSITVLSFSTIHLRSMRSLT